VEKPRRERRLTKICADKRVHIARCKTERTLAALQLSAVGSATRGFADLAREVRQGRYGLIAEIKKASPSRGLIADFDPPPWQRPTRPAGPQPVGPDR
jgi:indole-3-glycerol phosphate synthase